MLRRHGSLRHQRKVDEVTSQADEGEAFQGLNKVRGGINKRSDDRREKKGKEVGGGMKKQPPEVHTTNGKRW